MTAGKSGLLKLRDFFLLCLQVALDNTSTSPLKARVSDPFPDDGRAGISPSRSVPSSRTLQLQFPYFSPSPFLRCLLVCTVPRQQGVKGVRAFPGGASGQGRGRDMGHESPPGPPLLLQAASNSPLVSSSYFFFFSSLFVWLHPVLVAAHGIFHCSAGSSLWCTGFSLVVACRFSLSSCGTQVPGHVGSVVCGTQLL